MRRGADGRERSGEQGSHIILGNLRIARDQDQTGGLCLRDKKPVERIAMMHRQAEIRVQVRNLDLEHAITGLRNRFEEVGRQIELADRLLDRALP